MKACVVRVNLAGIERVSSKFRKAVPTSLARAEDRRELLAKFVQLTQLLLNRALEALVKERSELRGAKLADALLAHAEDVFSFYDLANVPGVDPEAVAQQQRILGLEKVISGNAKLVAVSGYLGQFDRGKAESLRRVSLHMYFAQ